MAAYYTDDATGNDGNSGSVLSPKKTVRAGCDLLTSPGDTLTIGNGTYDEQILEITGGSSGNPTIVRAQNRNLAILLPTSPDPGFPVIFLTEGYITIDGICCDATNIFDNGGINCRNDSVQMVDVTIRNGTCRNGTTPASVVFSEPNGILLDEGINYHIQNMDIHDFRAHGIYFPAFGGLVENCRIYDWSPQFGISGYGIQIYGDADPQPPDDNVLRANLIWNYQYGMILGIGDNDIAHSNVIWDCIGDGIRIKDGATNAKACNNTIYACGGYGVKIDGTASNSVVKNNILYLNTLGPIDDGGVSTTASNNLSTDPSFTNEGADDFTLQAGSDAIGTGVDLSIFFTTDFNGDTRTVPWDRGAYLGTASSPPPTTGASLVDNFIYATGADLASQNGGSGFSGAWASVGTGAITCEVAPAGSYLGGNAARCQATSGAVLYRRDFSGQTAGTFSIFVRLSTATPNGVVAFHLGDGDVDDHFVVRLESGYIKLYDNDSLSYVPVAAFAADSWYQVEIEFGSAGHTQQYRVRVNGGLWSAWTAPYTGSFAEVNYVLLKDFTTAAHTLWFDAIGAPAGSGGISPLVLRAPHVKRKKFNDRTFRMAGSRR